MSFKQRITQLLNPRAKYDDMPAFTDVILEAQAPMGARSGLHVRHILGNTPLMIGLLLVSGLFLIVLFGPAWAPQNPYVAGQHIVPHFDRDKQEFIRPPLVPSAEYPLGTDQWGTDILSLLMHGARNTLVAAAFITMIRLFLGVLLGGMAGWHKESRLDQLIMGLVGILAALPLLITAMILIFALDIRRGLPAFIIALSLIGWTEIAQYIRSQFLQLRQQPFIEGAEAVGMSGLQIAVRHILPNVLPHLLVLTFLEMGAVLMLLGELGFVQVYIGGGSKIDLSEPLGPQVVATLADVPEWGAMVADGFRWLRSKPHVVFPPAAAFFIAVMGFNLLGEGLRQLIEKRGFSTAFLLRKRMLGLVGGLTMATVFIMNNTGAAPWFAEIARNFNSAEAYAHVAALSQMDGRSVTQPGGAEAATYIAEKFVAYGLEPGWRRSSYIYPIETELVQPTAQPVLEVVTKPPQDSQVEPVSPSTNLWEVTQFQHQLDFGYIINGHGGSGDVTAPLTFIGFDPSGKFTWESYIGLDLRGRIALVLQDNMPPGFTAEAQIRGAAGILVITNKGRDSIRSQIQVQSVTGSLRQPTIPIFRVRPGVMPAFLDNNHTLTDLFSAANPSQQGTNWFTHDLETQVHMSLKLGEPQRMEVPAIVGYLPGSDFTLAAELVVLFSSYDSLGTDPDGTLYPGANHSASGVAVMLEMARLWQEQNLDPRRTVLLIAWPHNQLDDSTARAFLDSQSNFRHLRASGNNGRLLPTHLFQLDYLGAGGEVLLLPPQADAGLRRLIEETAAEFDIPVVTQADTPEFSTDIVSRNPRWITFKWAGTYPAPHNDTLQTIDQNKLQKFGQMFALTMAKILREDDY